MAILKKLLVGVGVVVLVLIGAVWWYANHAELDIYVPMFADNCGQCHGEDLRGTDKGGALVGVELAGGDTVAALVQSITFGAPGDGMPAFKGTLSALDIKGMAIYVAERRRGMRFTDFGFERAVHVPSGVVSSESHRFHVETLISGLSPLIFSIEPLPDGTWLVTEKQRGLSVITPEWERSPPIVGTPETSEWNFSIRGVQAGNGWLLDVAAHPDYARNGWIYLHYTHLCGERCDGEPNSMPLLPSSMNRLDRGRIVDGQWVDVETIWEADTEFYNFSPDTGAGGRVTFDESGNVYLSVGIKELQESDVMNYPAIGPQQLDIPYGKIHRVTDDGRIPPDNPLVAGPRASQAEQRFTRQSVWTYGHRSPQGLEWNPLRQRVWNAEMGPRGGDEINELIGGANYGWPFYSQGIEYTGVAVARHEHYALEFDPDDIEHTLVDITPSPGTSSFAFYTGDAFPGWRDNVLLGSLKGRSLFRMVFDGTKHLHTETLVEDLARIRDVEIGYDGLVYLLLEHELGSSVVRLVPADAAVATARRE